MLLRQNLFETGPFFLSKCMLLLPKKRLSKWKRLYMRVWLHNLDFFESLYEHSNSFEVGLQGIKKVYLTVKTFPVLSQCHKESYYLVPLDGFDLLHGDLLTFHCLLEEVPYMKPVLMPSPRFPEDLIKARNKVWFGCARRALAHLASFANLQ